MDRFKFRIWFEGRFIYKSLCDSNVYTDDDKCICLANNLPNLHWEQCTGLKDKNGKLIYEGDWLKTKDGYYCFVVWFDGFWWVKSLPSNAMDLEHAEFYKECEVIGNIHENADLLGE